ncbi:MAG: TadE family protein [Acidimicrobiia bacterium]|nr:TadE family protein [Acidimicrobiia bacterium]
MARHARRRWPWRRDSRGSALIEVALMAPVLLMLMLGIFSTGFALSNNISLNYATREAARFGATLPIEYNLPAWLVEVSEVAVEAGNGKLDPGIDGRRICVAFVSPGSDPSDRTTRYVLDENDNATTTVGQSCFDDGRPVGERRVQVLTERNFTFQTGVKNSTLLLSSETSVRFERFNG